MNEGIFNFKKFDMPLKEMDSYLGGQGKFRFSKETNTYIYRGKELLQYGNSVFMDGINTGIGPSNGMVKIPRNSCYSCTTREEFNRMKKELSAWLSNELPRILSAKNDIKRAEEWADAQGAELQRKIERNRRLIAQDQQDMQDSNYRKEANRAASYMGTNPLREGAGKKQRVRINEQQLRQIVTESVKKVLRENDEFTPHGYMTKSNWGGTEVQISNDGSSARFRDNYGDGPGKPTDWLEIEFDEDGVAYVTLPNGGQERLDNYMRY